jgi:hypothetical protein
MSTRKGSSRKSDELRREYRLAELKHPVRAKYHARTTAGSNVVLLDADVARAFPTAEAVNQALRMLVAVAKSRVPEAKRKRRTA